MRQLARLSLFVLIGVALFASDANASHFRYATIRWQPSVTAVNGVPTVQPNVIVFTMDSVWRKSAFFPGAASVVVGMTTVNVGAFTFGDGSSAPIVGTVTGFDTANDWVAVTWSVTKVYPAADAVYSAQMSSNARISTLLDGNRDRPFIVTTTVKIKMDAANASPSSGTLPIVVVPGDTANATFSLAASDPENDSLLFSIAPTTVSGLAKAAPDGLSIDPSTGVVTWNTRGRALGLYAVQFLVSDSNGAMIPVDVLLQVIPPTNLAPPSMRIDGSSTQTTFIVPVGTTVSFNVTGVDSNVDPGTGQPNRFVTLSASGLPIGSSLNPLVPVTLRSAATTAFTWTPTQSQVGNYTVTFGVTTDTGQQATNSAKIVVPQFNRPPAIACPAPVVVPYGTAASASATVSDPDGNALTVAWTVAGAGVQTDNVPPSQTPTAVALSRDFGAVGTYAVGVTVTDASNVTATCSFDVSVVKADTTTTLSSTASPSAFRQPITFTAIVSSVAPGAGIPSGAVTFMEGGTTLAGPLPVDANGLAAFTMSALSAGTHAITVEYSGSETLNASVGSTTHVVNKAETSLAVTSSTNPSTYREEVTFTATVIGGGAPANEGTVTFKEGPTVLAGPMPLDVDGTASYSTSTLRVGTHTITVEYGGSANFTPSLGTTNQIVDKTDTTTTVTSSVNPSVFRQSTRLTATVTAGGAAASGGTVTFKEGATVLGYPVTVGTSGTASVRISTLTAGTHTITAEYSGGSNFNASVGSINQVVNKADTSLTVTSLLNPSTYGQEVTLTVAVLSGEAETAEGSVTFKEGSTILAGPIALDAAGHASLTTAALNAGTHAITVDYSGGDNFNPSTSSFDQVVTRATPTITVNGFTGVYDAQPHGAAGSASGVGGADLTASLNLGGTFTNVPGGTVHWTFAGGTNYTDAQGDVAVTIAPRPAVITANNRVKEYGDVAIFTGAEFAAAGFVGADRVTGVTLTSTGAAATAAVGAHPIVPAAAIGAGLGNYAIEYRDGALLVQDTTAPVLTLPEPISQAATAAGGAAVTFAVSASDRHDGALAATCTPASGSTFPIGVTTVTCTATDASGNTATGSFTVTITDDRTPGKMHGGGHVMSGAHRYDFNFSVLELFNGRAFGWFKLKVCTPVTSRYWRDDDDFSRYKSRGEDDDDDDDRNDHDFDRHEHDNEGRCAGTPGRFTATSFAFVRFSDDPAFVPGPWWQRKMMDTVVFRGNGLWNGVAGYRYEVTATDRGEPGRGRDTFKVTITAPDGTVVAQASAPLTAGNVQSIFLPDLSFLFELFPR